VKQVLRVLEWKRVAAGGVSVCIVPLAAASV
jgi:hypothetical protein